MVLVALAMVVLIGFAALAIDGGYLYYRHTRLQDVSDAVALAAAHELVETEDYKEAFKVAVDYAENNQIKIDSSDNSSFTADISYAGNELGTMTVSFPDEYNEVKVDISIDAKMYLATVLGIDQSPVAVSATARAGLAGEQTGNLIPVAFRQDENQDYDTYVSYDLSLANPSGVPGNNGYLDLNRVLESEDNPVEVETPGSNFEEYLEEGFPDSLQVNNLVSTYTGVSAGQVDQAIEERINYCQTNHQPSCSVDTVNHTYKTTVKSDCTRLVVVPIIINNDFMDSNGRSYVKIVGFATFYIEIYDKKDKVLTGYFLDTVNSSKVTDGDSDFMVKSVTLVK